MTTATREKPILFTPENVRAIIDGRKTQTRRVLKTKLGDDECPAVDTDGNWCIMANGRTQCDLVCPYGEVGGKLWVRESWMPLWDSGCGAGTCLPPTGQEDKPDIYKYRADGEKPKGFAGKWRHAMYMPRVASRLTLEITGIRVERVTDISASDCRAEGISLAEEPEPLQQAFAIAEYRHLWESINGPGSWAANQYVWAISFRRIEHAS